MHLVVFSYKHCWPDPDSPSGFATDGGFPLQMKSLSELFDRTTLVLPRASTPTPDGLTALTGSGLEVQTFEEPPGTDLRRKLSWLAGAFHRVPWLWRWAGRGDVVHAVVPGDVGFVGLILAWMRGRHILVRHCGTWDRPTTVADAILLWFLKRVAGRRCVVFATGGGEAPPSPSNPAIHWIFSTSLDSAELGRLAAAERSPADPPRLIQVGRLTSGKNAQASIRALAILRQRRLDVSLDLVGQGQEEQRLRSLALDLGVEDSVVFHGNLDHGGVIERLHGATLFLFPTEVAEGFPKAVLESLACGVPVLVPRVSVLPYLLRDGGGIVLEDVEPETVAQAVAGLLGDVEGRARHGEIARHVASSFSLEAWRDRIGARLKEAWGDGFTSVPSASSGQNHERPSP